MRYAWILAAVALSGCTTSPTLWRAIMIEMPACERSCTLTVTAVINQDREATVHSTDNFQGTPAAPDEKKDKTP